MSEQNLALNPLAALRERPLIGGIGAGLAALTLHFANPEVSGAKVVSAGSNITFIGTPGEANPMSQPPAPGAEPRVLSPTRITQESSILTDEVVVPNMSPGADANVRVQNSSKHLALEAVNGHKVKDSHATWSLTMSSANSATENLTFRIKGGKKLRLGSRVCDKLLINETDQNKDWRRDDSYVSEVCTKVGQAFDFQQVKSVVLPFFNRLYAGGDNFDLKKIVMSRRYLELDGKCNPANPLIPEEEKVIDRAKTQTTVFCTTVNGKHQSTTFPRSIFTTPEQRNLDYAQPLEQVAVNSANDSGFVGAEQGRSSRVVATQKGVSVKYLRNKLNHGPQLKSLTSRKVQSRWVQQHLSTY